MKYSYLSFLIVFFICFSTSAQLSSPETEDVYGGRILSITGYQQSPDTSRIFITTESANSAFSSKVYFNGTSYVFESFEVLPSMDANAGLGSGIRTTAVHESGVYFYVLDGELYQTHPDSTMSFSLSYMGVNAITIQDSIMLFLSDDKLYFGSLDLTGNYTNTGNITIPFFSGPNSSIEIAPISENVYLFNEGSMPILLKLSDTYNTISATTSLSNISPTTLSSINWISCGVGLDDRIFIGGTDFNNLYFSHSDDEIIWSEVNTGIQGAGGTNFAFSGSSSTYSVYNGKIYNSTSGSGSWFQFGNVGAETNPNDGAVYQDPNFSSVVFLTTDQGIGASDNNGSMIFEINDGVEAVQVKGIDMSNDKSLGWVASKSGIRKVNDYTTTPSWSNAIYPQGDGSPYFSIALNQQDTGVVYAGNTRVYKSTDGGMNWNMMFTAENPPWNFPSFGAIGDITIVSALEVCPSDSSIVMAGYYLEDSAKGGLFVSHDAGFNWSQILLEASVDGEDVDVRDILFNIEGSDTIAYVGVVYDLSYPQGVAIYRLVKNGSSWLASQDMGPTGTVVGYQIVATIRDLELSVTGDTIFATGTDAGINHPIVYFKDLSSTGLWEAMTTSGFPFVAGKQGRAITIGNDTVYCAVDNEIYYYEYGSSAWQLGYSYPLGTEINFLYFDDLLVGTSTGLYGHTGGGITNIEEIKWFFNNNSVVIYPNPTQDQLNLKFDTSVSVVAQLFNMNGSLVKTYSMNGKNMHISIADLKQGVYLLKLSTKDNSWSKQIVITK